MAKNLCGLLDAGAIVPVGEAASRAEAITLLSEALSKTTGLTSRRIESAVMERERLGSTGVGEGVAIPHARLEGLASPTGGYLRLVSGVDFQAIDERPCDLIFMLLAPDDNGVEHLRALAQVSRFFRQSAVRDQLRAATTPDGVRAILCAEAVSG